MLLCGSTKQPSDDKKSFSSSSSGHRTSSGSHKMVPLLLHFDVNKTVIQSDSIQSKTIEEGIREGISELFWGAVSTSGGEPVWQWAKGKPGCVPPVDEAGELVSYAAFCKDAVKDKSKRKAALKSFSHVRDPETKEEMEKLVQLTLKRMQLPQDVRYTKEAEAAGITTPTLNMFPTLFHLVAALQRTTRPFAILFRSFGADHEKIQNEWNAFCELRHPVYSRLIEGIGPLDGSVPHIPDRRILGLHTLYRDEKGPILFLISLPMDHPRKAGILGQGRNQSRIIEEGGNTSKTYSRQRPLREFHTFKNG